MAGPKNTSDTAKAGEITGLEKDYRVHPPGLPAETLILRDARLKGGFETVSGWVKKDRLEEFWSEYEKQIGGEDLEKFRVNWDYKADDSEEYLNELVANREALCDRMEVGDILYPMVVVTAMEDNGYVALRLWTCRKALFEHTLLGSFFATEMDIKRIVDSDVVAHREVDKDRGLPNLTVLEGYRQKIEAQKEVQRKYDESIRPLWDVTTRCLSMMIEAAEGVVLREKQWDSNGPLVLATLEQILNNGLEILSRFDDYGIEEEEIEKGIQNLVDETKYIWSLYQKMDSDKLKLLFDTISNLPSGEIERLSTTVKKRAEKWSEGIPTMAPELFTERRANENLPDFLRRVYKDTGLLNGKLTTAHFDIIDPPLSVAVRNWIKHHGALPEDINLPNKVQRERGTPRKVSRQKDQKSRHPK